MSVLSHGLIHKPVITCNTCRHAHSDSQTALDFFGWTIETTFKNTWLRMPLSSCTLACRTEHRQHPCLKHTTLKNQQKDLIDENGGGGGGGHLHENMQGKLLKKKLEWYIIFNLKKKEVISLRHWW